MVNLEEEFEKVKIAELNNPLLEEFREGLYNIFGFED